MLVLNVAEKPSVAKEISHILSSGISSWRSGQSKYNPIYEFSLQIKHQNARMVFTSVIGHMMGLEFPPQYRSWKQIDPLELFNAPVLKKIKADTIQQEIANTLRAEAKKAQWLILWLDCDREGENIAFEVKSICEQVNPRLAVFRAKFSALIPRDILQAVQNLGRLNEHLSLACDARAEIDLRLGAAFTRFQTMRLQNKYPGMQKNYGVISYGPCQFPTLGFVVDRYMEIQQFTRKNFYYLTVTHRAANTPSAANVTFAWKRQRLYDPLACLCIYEQLMQDPVARINQVDKKATWKRKPLPLTTVELQKRASRWLRISSEITMKAAESLYNKGLISYPRTETNKFKEGTDLHGLVELHEKHPSWGRYVTDKLINGDKFEIPRSGNADDEAHPPIHPTKSLDLNSVSDSTEKKIYEFVTLHFLACCSKDAQGFQTNITMQMQQEEFTATGLMITERNYLDIYRFEKWSNSAIPVYQLRDQFIPTTFTLDSGETAPPPLLSEADLIARMDSNGIGTDATIAEHIKTILKREYAVKVNNDTQFKPTLLGLALVQAYEQLGFDLAKPRLRAAMEADCKAIATSQKDVHSVVRGCMNQMKDIFHKVQRSAAVMDRVFAQHFLNHSQGHLISVPDVQAPDAMTLMSRCGSCGNNMNFQVSEQHLECTTCSSNYILPKHQRVTATNHNCSVCDFQVLQITSETQEVYILCPKCHQSGNGAIVPATITPDIESHKSDTTCNSRTLTRCPLSGISAETMLAGAQSSSKHMNLAYPYVDDKSLLMCLDHNMPAVLRQVKREGPNKGRYFYVCSLPNEQQCNFFWWQEDQATSRQCLNKAQTGSHDFVRPTRSSAIEGRQQSATLVQSARGQENIEPVARNIPRCLGHGDVCLERKCRKRGPNFERIFYVCSMSQTESCGFFEWKDQ